MRTLTLIHGDAPRPAREELLRREAAGTWPRVTLYERELESDLVDAYQARRAPGLRGALQRRLPAGPAVALEAFSRRGDYDAFVSWAEPFGLSMAGLLAATRHRKAHVGLFSWISTPRKARLFRRLHPYLDRIVLWSSVQHAFARRIGIPERKIVRVGWLVDQQFWTPRPGAGDTVVAAGREMRDYATMIEALKGWDVPAHIAANAGPGRSDRWMQDVEGAVLPPNVTWGPKPYPELRELYARARFVVIPLYPTDTDNGITVMTEAMAMGKAVICSRVDGQQDLLEDGVNGLFVPPRDPAALRAAMERLWADPALCLRMGEAGRRKILQNHTLDAFVAGVKRAVHEAIDEVKRA